MGSITDKVAVVIVTFNRAELLRELIDSVHRMTIKPYRLVIVDNCSTDGETPALVDAIVEEFPEGTVIAYHSEENTGGSGGFSKGMQLAVDSGAEWAWLMDDDVEILPEALERFAPWMEKFKVLHGRRYDFDGSPFYWQAKFNNFLGVPLPYTIRDFNAEGYAITNSGTFEGMMVNTEIPGIVGLPDPRFFISWDDAAYAWICAQHTEVAYVNAFVIQRKRKQRQVNLGIRHLNDSSPMVKYYMMRNRGYIANYFRWYHKLHPMGFGFGTFLTFCKEIVRLLVVEHSLKGIDELNRGFNDAKKLRRDTTWRPMPPYPRTRETSA